MTCYGCGERLENPGQKCKGCGYNNQPPIDNSECDGSGGCGGCGGKSDGQGCASDCRSGGRVLDSENVADWSDDVADHVERNHGHWINYVPPGAGYSARIHGQWDDK
jgi:hypothetical protein